MHALQEGKETREVGNENAVHSFSFIRSEFDR